MFETEMKTLKLCFRVATLSYQHFTDPKCRIASLFKKKVKYKTEIAQKMNKITFLKVKTEIPQILAVYMLRY